MIFLETVYRIKNWFLNLVRPGKREREMKVEIESHLELDKERSIRSGMTPAEARKISLRQFGHVDGLKEECRDSWGTRVVTDLIRDLRYSIRSLWKSKVFSFAVVTTLALCIGANTTVLSALYSLILKPLPVENPERLVQLFNVVEGRLASDRASKSSWNQYSELRTRKDLFEGCALRVRKTKAIRRDTVVRRLNGYGVSSEFFELVNAKPVLGRFFLPEEVDPGPGHVVVLPQRVWETEYDADPNVLGQQIHFDAEASYAIIGVAPRSLETFDYESRFIIPYHVTARDRNPAEGRYQAWSFDLWLRLKPGVSRAMALQQIRAMERRWYEEEADADARNSYKTYKDVAFDRPHPLTGSLYLLEGGSLLVLLVGCFNVMTLIVSRSNQRRLELTIRSSLGAGQSSLRRLMLCECSLLVAAAVCLGMTLALSGTYMVNEYLSVLSPMTVPISLDYATLFITLAMTIGLVGAMGLLPLEIFRKTGFLERVDSSQRTASVSGFSRRLSDGMVVGQVAIAFIMLVGAGLLFRSFQNVLAVDPGFDASQIVEGRLDWGTIHPRYKKRSDAAVLKQRVHAAMQEIPGVESVSLSMHNMFSADQRGGEFVGHLVSPEFFTTMNMPIIEGRGFQQGDTDQVKVVDELFARRFFPDRSPIGYEADVNQLLASGNAAPGIVGVVRRANLRGLEDRDGVPIVYRSRPLKDGWWEYSIFLRTSRPAASVMSDMRAKIREVDPQLHLSYTRPLDAALDEMLVSRRGMTLLLLFFAGLALLLSLIGVYAVLSYDVAQRRREIGIRGAIGANRSEVLGMVLRQGASKAGIGLALGFLASLYLTRFLEKQLFDVAAVDPWTYIVAGLSFATVALVASYLPARRAIRIDPLEALRVE